jgi:hypothetical protein
MTENPDYVGPEAHSRQRGETMNDRQPHAFWTSLSADIGLGLMLMGKFLFARQGLGAKELAE